MECRNVTLSYFDKLFLCYVLQYLEKKADGSSVFRNARSEEKAARQFDQECQRRMEQLYSKLQQEYEQSCPDGENSDMNMLQSTWAVSDGVSQDVSIWYSSNLI